MINPVNMSWRDSTIYKYVSCVISGLISTTIFHPIDVARTRFFFGSNGLFNFKILYNGFTFSAITAIIKQSAVFPTQELINAQLKETTHLTVRYREQISGLLSGVILSFVATPINAIKVPLMTKVENTSISTIKQIYKTYGIKGFYRGGVGTLYRDALWNGLYFPIFSELNNMLNNRFIASVMSGAIAMCVSYPFDGIRLFRQNNKADYNFWHGFKYSFNRSPENIKSFVICMIRVPMSVAMSHYIYLVSNDTLNKITK